MIDLQIKCGRAERNRKRFVMVLLDRNEIHRDRLDTDTEWHRKKFREVTIAKIYKNLPSEQLSKMWRPGGNDDNTALHAEIEQKLIAAADAEDQRADSDSACGRKPVLICLADVDARPTQWLWPGRVAKGRITLAVGMPGVGKSFLTTDMAARISTGTPWPDGSVCPKGSVILISAEDDPHDTIRPRLDAHRADVTRVHLLASVIRADDDGEETELMFSLADVDALENALQQVNDCQLIVVDPIGSFLGGRTDSHRDNEVRSVLAPVAKLAEKHGPAVLIVAHRRKGGGGNADDLALGSRAFTGIARSVWHLTTDTADNQRRLLLPGKNNLAEQQLGLAFTISGEPAAVRWESDPVAMTADEALALENGNKGHSTALDEAAAWLSGELADGPKAGKEVKDAATAAGIKPRTIDRAKIKLGVETGPDGFRGPWVWRLPDSASVRQEFAECAKENSLANCGESGELCEEHPPETGEVEDDGTVPF